MFRELLHTMNRQFKLCLKDKNGDFVKNVYRAFTKVHEISQLINLDDYIRTYTYLYLFTVIIN